MNRRFHTTTQNLETPVEVFARWMDDTHTEIEVSFMTHLPRSPSGLIPGVYQTVQLSVDEAQQLLKELAEIDDSPFDLGR